MRVVSSAGLLATAPLSSGSAAVAFPSPWKARVKPAANASPAEHRCSAPCCYPKRQRNRGCGGIATWPPGRTSTGEVCQRLRATVSGDGWEIGDDGHFTSDTCGEVDLNDPEIISLSETILRSYALTFPDEDPLVPANEQATTIKAAAVELFLAPFAVLAHDRVELPDGSRTNVYNYANKRGLEVFERTWEEQCSVPSGKSAAASGEAQSGRNTLIGQCLHQGWQDVSGAVRQSSTGKVVTLQNGKLWNLTDENGVYAGQAVVITNVTIDQ